MLAELAHRVRSGALPARALVDDCAERIDAANARLQAVTQLRLEQARVEADRIDRLDPEQKAQLPLCGIPALVKDVDDVAAMVTTHGSRLRADDEPAAYHGRIASHLTKAGAIIIGKTNTCEFAFEGYTSNLLYGSTANPWGGQWSPGGSSGGSAASLSAALAPIATGTDGGGSVRIPASLCGLLGYKPTNGLIGRDPIPAWIDCHTDGIMTTHTGDAQLLMSLYQGPAPGDNSGTYSPAGSAPIQRILAVPRLHGLEPLPDVIDVHFRSVLRAWADAIGAGVEWLSRSQFGAGARELMLHWETDWTAMTSAEQAQLLGREVIRAHADAFSPQFAELMEYGLSITLDDYLAARRRCLASRKLIDELLPPGTIVVSPTLVTTGYAPDGRMPDGSLGSPEGMAQTVLASLTGHPAVSIPAGRLPNGLPFGIQAMSARGEDGTLLDLAALLERTHGWPDAAPGYRPFE